MAKKIASKTTTKKTVRPPKVSKKTVDKGGRGGRGGRGGGKGAAKTSGAA